MPRPRGVLGGERETAGHRVEQSEFGRKVRQRGVEPVLPLHLAVGGIAVVVVVVEEIAVEHSEGRVGVDGIKGKPAEMSKITQNRGAFRTTSLTLNEK